MLWIAQTLFFILGEGEVEIELRGSPHQLIIQLPGVVYALNCYGPAFRAHSGIIYTSEFSQFANYTHDFNFGNQVYPFYCLPWNLFNVMIHLQFTDDFFLGGQDVDIPVMGVERSPLLWLRP